MNKTVLQNSTSLTRSLGLSIFAAALMSTSGHAQDEGPGLDTIVVTAERKEENLQRVPLAVTALPAEQLDSLQIVTTRDLSRAVPNLVTANNVGLGSSVTYFLRGVGNTESIPTFDLPIGTYVDEVFISRQNANQIALSGVERVEVLRGPQGTLFGRNTTGGAVSIITKKPGDEFSGELEVGYGSFDRYTVNTAVNLPVNEQLAVRLSAIYVSDDGFIENEQNTSTFNGEETSGFRAAVRYDLNDNITWNGSAQYVHTDTLGLGTPAIIDPATGVISQEPVSGDLLTVNIPDQDCEPTGPVETFPGQGCTFNETESIFAVSNLGVDLGFASLNFISGYYQNDFRFNVDFLGNTNQPIFGGLFGANFFISNDTRTEQFSQEIKLTGSALGDRLSYTAGVFFIDEQNETFFADTVNLPIAPGFTLPAVLANRAPLSNGTRSFAVYGQGDLSITDRLQLQVGLRWTEEDKDIALEGESLSFATFSNVPLDSAALEAVGVPLRQVTARVTPRVALFYDVAENVSVYASYTEGFRSGGWNVRGTSALEFQPFDEEIVDSYEIGYRSELFNNRLRFNATLFNAIYNDFQIPSVFPGSATFLTLNSGRARVRGLEVDFLASFFEGFDVFGNFGLQDGDYTELTEGAIAAGIGPELQRTPTLTGQIGFNKYFTVGENELRLGADVSYTGEHQQSPSNDPESFVDEQAILNIQGAWTFPGDRLTVIAECSNCTNEVFVTQALFGVLFPSQPRRWGVRGRINF